MLINGARRAGKSAIISAIPAHTAKTKPGSITLIIAPTQKQSLEDMRYVKQLARADAGYPRLVRDSDSQIELSNGSRIIVLPATEVAARGYPNPDLIIADEAAFIEDKIHKDCLAPMLNENPDCKWLQISTTNGKMQDPGRFFFECSLDPMWERYEIRAPYDVDPKDALNLLPATPEATYRALKAEEGIIAGYSPRHMDRETQITMLRIQGPSKYQRNQLALFVDSADQAFSYEDIRNAFEGGGDNGFIPRIEDAEAEALFV